MPASRFTLAAAVVVTAATVAGCSASGPSSAGVASAAVSSASAAAGQCRFVTAAEVAAAAGLAAVKPTETKGPCFYVLNPAQSVPSIDPRAGTIPPIPRVIAFAYYTDAYPISVVDTELQQPKTTAVPGLGVKAGSLIDADGDYNFEARLAHGVVEITVERPDPPQTFRTDDLTTIAVQIFRYAQPRIS